MPIFDYQCSGCGQRFEVLQKLDALPPAQCPACGAATLTRCLAAPGIQLRGEGWRRGAAKPPRKGPAPRRMGHTLDGGSPHSHEESSSTRDSRSGTVPDHGRGHDHGHDHDH